MRTPGLPSTRSPHNGGTFRPWPSRIALTIIGLLLTVYVVPHGLAGAAKRSLEQGQSDSAQHQLKWALAVSIRRQPEWYFLLGRAAHQNKDLETARRAYREVLTIEPAWRDAHLELGRVLFVAGGERNHRASLDEMTAELTWHPDNVRAYYTRGLVYGWLKRWEEAEADFLAFLAAKPDSEWGHNDLAWVYFSQSEWGKAEVAARTALEIDPNFMWGHNGLGVALLNQRRPSEAAASLDRALILAENITEDDYRRAYPGNDPTFAPQARDAFVAGVAFNLGVVHTQMGERERAIGHYERASSLLTDEATERTVGISKSDLDNYLAALKERR